MPLRHQDSTTGRWNGIDPVTHFSSSTYAGYNNNPVYWADPSGAWGTGVICAIRTGIGVAWSNPAVRKGVKLTLNVGTNFAVSQIGGGNDWFKSEKGDLIWQDSNKESLKINGVKYRNRGTTVSVPNTDGTYVVYYQNIFLGINNSQVTEAMILSTTILLDKIMYSRNLTDLSRASLMISLMHRSTGIAAEIIFDIATTITPFPELRLLKYLPKLGLSVFFARETISILPQFTRSVIDDAVRWAMSPNKLRHLFGNSQHNFATLVEQLGGAENTIRAVLNAVNGRLPLSGTFRVSVVINGFTIEIRGAVVNGIPKIGTMFIP